MGGTIGGGEGEKALDSHGGMGGKDGWGEGDHAVIRNKEACKEEDIPSYGAFGEGGTIVGR